MATLRVFIVPSDAAARSHGTELAFEVSGGHPVTAGLSRIGPTNVRTMRAERFLQDLLRWLGGLAQPAEPNRRHSGLVGSVESA